MRIAVNARFLMAPLEGMGWYTHELTRRMAAAHPEDEFILLFDRPYDRQFRYGPNVKMVMAPPPARHILLWHAWYEVALPLAFRYYKPDVFFSPDSHLSLRAKVPTLMAVHDLVPLQFPESIQAWSRPYYQKYLPKFMRRADHLVTVSEFTKKSIVETGCAPPERISVVYNGCRDSFHPLTETEQAAVRAQYAQGQPYFFYTGSIHPRKNLPRLMRAFDRFKADTGAPAKLLIAGRLAWQTEATEAAYAQSPYKSDIHLLGYVPESELPRLMAAARALTYVSLNEGFGLPVLEAFHCGVPALTSNTTALPEVAGKAALLVDPESEDAIYENLKKIYADEALRAELLRHAPEQKARFNWDQAAITVYDLLKKLRDT